MRQRSFWFVVSGLGLLLAVFFWLLQSDRVSSSPSPALLAANESPAPAAEKATTATRDAAPPSAATTPTASTAPLAPRQRIDGVVIGPLGHPVADAQVRALQWPDVENAIATTSSDSRGQFSFVDLENATNRLIHAEAPGFTPGRAVASFRSGATETAVVMRLWDGAVLSGRVIDPEGQPVAGAAVLATNDYSWVDGGLHSPECRTDAEGAFELAGVPAGRFVLRVHANGFAMAEHVGDSLAEPRVEVRLAREGGARLEIELRNLPAELGPATTISLSAMRSGYGFAIPRHLEFLRFDASNRLVIDGLLRDVEWSLQMPELAGWVFEPREQRLPAGSALHRVTYTAVQDGSIVLRGVLRNATGAPLAGERLVCYTQRSQSMGGGRPGQATTDAEGRFEMIAPLAPAEPYTLHLAGSRHVLRQAKTEGMKGHSDPRYLVRHEGQASSEPLELVAVESAMVAGRLLRADDQPVPYQWIELKSEEKGWGWFPRSYAVTGPDGSFLFRAFHAPTTPLQIQANSNGIAAVHEVQLAPGQQLADLIVRVEPTGSVSGIVRDELGAPLAGIVVSLSSVDLETKSRNDRGGSTVLSDRSGRFRIPTTSTGGKRLSLKKPDRSKGGESEVFEVFAGQESVVDLTWNPPPPPKREGK